MSPERYHPKYADSHRGYHPYYPSGGQYNTNNFPTPKPWACDFCHKATFRTFEEANEHEKHCHMNYQARRSPSSSISYSEDRSCHTASKPSETIHSHTPSKTQERRRDEKNRLLLAMPSDHESLSNRQCYVRSEFVEIFTATGVDVASRHSKGAQKLYVGQIGLRCKYCQNLPIRDRTERSVCFPSSISRIYQTVADMQRFHFEQCSSIPDDKRKTYKTLKTTRPRGVGSPQQYWIISAQKLGLIDTPKGIRLGTKQEKRCSNSSTSSQSSQLSNVSPLASPSRRDPSPLSPSSTSSVESCQAAMTPLSPPASGTSQLSIMSSSYSTEAISVKTTACSVPLQGSSSKSSQENGVDTSDASILLSLRNTLVRTVTPERPLRLTD